MLAFLCSVSVLLALVEGQGAPAGGTGGQECVLLITSPIYVCDDESSLLYMDTSKIETIRHNETVTFVTGEVGIMKPFDKTTQLEIVLYKKANGKKEMMLSLEMTLCDEIGNPESDYASLLQYLGFPETCPVEPGIYPVNDLVADMEGLPINSGNIGDYEAVMNFWECEDDECKEKRFECCAKLDCIIEPV